MEFGHAIFDGVRDREVKQHLLIDIDRTLNKALNQVLKLEAAKAAAGTPGSSDSGPDGNTAAKNRAPQEWAISW
jgi:hypothetical protein